MVFSSDRPGTLGAMDVYRSTRASATGGLVGSGQCRADRQYRSVRNPGIAVG